MIAIILTELRKLTTTKVWWVMLLIAFAYVALADGALVWAAHAADSLNMGAGQAMPMPTGADLARMVYAAGPAFGYVFPALLGAMMMSSEYRHRTITPTFLAEPHRGRVLLGKLVAMVPFGVAIGAAVVAASVLAGGGMLYLFGLPTGLGDWSTQEFFLRTIVSMTVWGLVGVGLGALLKHQVAAIVALLGFTQFLEPILRTLPMFTGNSYPWLNYLPGAVGDAINGSSLYSFMTTTPAAPLSFEWALLVLIGYAALFSLVGYFTTIRRDVS